MANKDEFDFDFDDEDNFQDIDEQMLVDSNSPIKVGNTPLPKSVLTERNPDPNCEPNVCDNFVVNTGLPNNSISMSPSYSPDCSIALETSVYFNENESFEDGEKESRDNILPKNNRNNDDQIKSTTISVVRPEIASTPAPNFEIPADGFDDSDDDLFSQIDLNHEQSNCQNESSKSGPHISPICDQLVERKRDKSDNCDSNSNGKGLERGNVPNRIEFVEPRIASTPIGRNIISAVRSNTKRQNESAFSPHKALPVKEANADSLAAFERFTNTDTVYRLKRRFPGPAGLLPTISPKELKLLNHSPHPLSQQFSKIIAEDTATADKEVVALQGIIPGLESENDQCVRKAPWKEILKHLRIDISNEMCPLHFMNIRWIRTKALKMTSFFKIPFLLVVLQEAPEIHVGRGKVRLKNPSVKLIDTTGSIVAAMDAGIIESFGEELQPGTAIALRNIGILRFKRQVVLTITRKNLICMTSFVNDNINVNDSQDSTNNLSSKLDAIRPVVIVTDENVKITKLCDFDSDQVMKEYKEITSVKVHSVDELYSCGGRNTESPGLFTNIGNIQNNLTNCDSRRQNTMPVEAVAVNKTAVDDNMSAFDDDDDELFQALDNIDFGNEDIF